MRYSFERRDWIFVKCNGILSFAKNTGKNLSGKYSQKLLDHAKQSVTDTLKAASKKSNSINSRSSQWFDW